MKSARILIVGFLLLLCLPAIASAQGTGGSGTGGGGTGGGGTGGGGTGGGGTGGSGTGGAGTDGGMPTLDLGNSISDTGSSDFFQDTRRATGQTAGAAGGNRAQNNAGGRAGGQGGFGGGAGGFSSPGGLLGQLFGGGAGAGPSTSRRTLRAPLRAEFEVLRPEGPQVSQTLQRRFTNIQPLRSVGDGIQVEVVDRVATLRGVVETERQKDMAERMARLEPGISKVINELVVSSNQ